MSYLEQTFEDFELIISDDGSNPKAAALYDAAAAKDPRVRVVHHDRNHGHPWNFAFLLREARGALFLLGSDDDIRDREFLARAVHLLGERPFAVGTSSPVLLVDAGNEPINPVAFSDLMASERVTDRIRSLGSGAVQFDYYGLFRTHALRATSILLPSVHDLWGIETLVLLELLLQGPVLRVNNGHFRYRMKDGWNNTSLASFIISTGSEENSSLYDQEARRSRLLRRALSQYSMPFVEKARATIVLETLLRSDVFTAERQGLARHAFKEAMERHHYVAGLVASLKYLALSPAALLRSQAWKSLSRGLSIPPIAKIRDNESRLREEK
jgi:glycosyltransferase involved in cell wall biosynthesis